MATFFHTNIDNGEDPLETFRDKSEVELRRKERIRQILIKDKQMQKVKYANSLGVSVRELRKREFNINETPIQKLLKETDVISVKTARCIRILNMLQKNYTKIKNNENIPDDDKEDMKDRLR